MPLPSGLPVLSLIGCSCRPLFLILCCLFCWTCSCLGSTEHPSPAGIPSGPSPETASPAPNTSLSDPSPFHTEEDPLENDPLEPFDPFEPVNRAIFEFNYVIDGLLLNPLIHIYRGITPSFFQDGIHNVLTNLVTPVYFLNDILQLDFEEASVHFTRFWLNTLFGVLGLFDVATELGIHSHENNLYQTLGRWDVGPGPYIVLPILGPSDLRNILGTVGDFFLDPFNYAAIHTDHRSLLDARAILTYVDKKSHLVDTQENLAKTSLDYYAALRSMYWQRTYAKVHTTTDEATEGELAEPEVVFF